MAWQIWRRRNWKNVAGGPRVVFYGNHSQLAFRSAFKPALPVNHARKLARCHSVDCRNRVKAYVRLVALVADWAGNAVDVGVGPVKNHKRNVVLRAGFHDVMHRAYVGVKASAHVLYVVDKNVNVRQKLGRGP